MTSCNITNLMYLLFSIAKKIIFFPPFMPLQRLYTNIIIYDHGNGEIHCFYTENILRSLNKHIVLQSGEIYKIFYSKEFFRKIIFSGSQLWLFSIDRSFRPNLLFKIVCKVNILILSLFSLLVACAIHFSRRCCEKSANNEVIVIW